MKKLGSTLLLILSLLIISPTAEARFYDAETGRFLTEDPIGFAGGDVNLKSYVGQNPVNYTDPSGLKIIWGNYVLTSKDVVKNFNKLNNALIKSRGGVDDFILKLTGGDRYIDEDGNHRSCTDNQIVKDSATNSPHLIENGARGIDFSTQNLSINAINQILPTTSFRNNADSILNHYEDNHIHLNLPNIKKFGGKW